MTITEVWQVSFSGRDLESFDELVRKRGTDRLETLQYILNYCADLCDVSRGRDVAKFTYGCEFVTFGNSK